MNNTYSMQAVSEAAQIMKALLLKGWIERHDALYQKYHGAGQEEVRDLIQKVHADVWDVVVYEGQDGLHLFTAPGNAEIGYRAQDLRDRLLKSSSPPGELNLYLFVMMGVASLAQGDPESGMAGRMYFRDTQVVEFVDQTLSALDALDDVTEIESEYGLDIQRVAHLWFERQTADERNPNRTQKNRLGVVRKVLTMWQEEGLIRLEEDGRVFPLPRLLGAMAAYYGERRRKDDLMSLFKTAASAQARQAADVDQHEWEEVGDAND